MELIVSSTFAALVVLGLLLVNLPLPLWAQWALVYIALGFTALVVGMGVLVILWGIRAAIRNRP